MKRVNDTQRWRKCAEDRRARARCLNEPDARRHMLATAETYDWLAETMERRTAHRRSVWEWHHRDHPSDPGKRLH